MKRLRRRLGILSALALTLAMLAGTLPAYASGDQSCAPNPLPATFVVTARMVIPDSKPPPSRPAPGDCPVHPGQPCDCVIRVFTITEPDCPVAPATMCCNPQRGLPVGNAAGNDNIALLLDAPSPLTSSYFESNCVLQRDYPASVTISTPHQPPRQLSLSA